jgi:hypothetical protein
MDESLVQSKYDLAREEVLKKKEEALTRFRNARKNFTKFCKSWLIICGISLSVYKVGHYIPQLISFASAESITKTKVEENFVNGYNQDQDQEMSR